jgi:class 3 adenylate cyclase
MASLTARTLVQLLDRRNEHPEQIPQIDRGIRQRFEQRQAVLVLDMCGFSRLSLRHGIVHFLAMIRRMQQVVGPLVVNAGGRVVKTEADNLFATFADVPPAVRASRRIGRALAAQNAVLPRDWDVHVGIGIGFGDLLLVGASDLYGCELNLAAKLGEDLAGPGDILLTEAARARGGRGPPPPRRERISGLTVTYHALVSAR